MRPNVLLDMKGFTRALEWISAIIDDVSKSLIIFV